MKHVNVKDICFEMENILYQKQNESAGKLQMSCPRTVVIRLLYYQARHRTALYSISLSPFSKYSHCT